jgi:phosphopantothenoylcysteine decarboxylase/phosphopantothenate--cysteine ligase
MLFPTYLIHLKQVVDPKIRVMMTKSAERFVPPEVIGWLTEDVLTCDSPGVNPTEVALRSRGIVVLPASAHVLASAALGLADSVATTAILAAPSPCLFFPTMNPVMWNKDIVHQHVITLRSRGHTVVEPELREAFEIWRGTTTHARSMPTPDKAARIVVEWLNEGRRPPAAA